MSSKPNFCSFCGEKLDPAEMRKCPKCGTDIQVPFTSKTSSPSIVEQLPYKSPGTTALIAFLGGLFALPGIGHIYVGKVRRGIIILISGLILYALTIGLVLSAVSFQGFMINQDTFSSDVIRDPTGVWLQITTLMLVFGIAYIVLFIWQIFNAKKLAKKFNEQVKAIGKEPW